MAYMWYQGHTFASKLFTFHILDPGGVHQLGIGGHHIVAPLPIQQGAARGHRLRQGQIVKAYAEDFRSQGTCLQY